jgi:hypothetical protein
MIGAGTFINPLLKIVTTVAILAAVYFFAIRPVLDTTEEALNVANPAIENAQEQFDRALDQAEQEIPGTRTFEYQVSGPPREVRRVTRCIHDATTVEQMQACIR